jgi:hypothetical protein
VNWGTISGGLNVYSGQESPPEKKGWLESGPGHYVCNLARKVCPQKRVDNVKSRVWTMGWLVIVRGEYAFKKVYP